METVNPDVKFYSEIIAKNTIFKTVEYVCQKFNKILTEFNDQHYAECEKYEAVLFDKDLIISQYLNNFERAVANVTQTKKSKN